MAEILCCGFWSDVRELPRFNSAGATPLVAALGRADGYACTSFPCCTSLTSTTSALMRALYLLVRRCKVTTRIFRVGMHTLPSDLARRLCVGTGRGADLATVHHFPVDIVCRANATNPCKEVPSTSAHTPSCTRQNNRLPPPDLTHIDPTVHCSQLGCLLT